MLMGIKITDKEMYTRLESLERSNTDQHNHIIGLIGDYKAQVKRLQYGMTGIGVLAITTLTWFISHLSK